MKIYLINLPNCTSGLVNLWALLLFEQNKERMEIYSPVEVDNEYVNMLIYKMHVKFLH